MRVLKSAVSTTIVAGFIAACAGWPGASSSRETLPAGIARFNPAGLEQAWTYEGPAFRVLRAPDESLETVAVVRLSHVMRGFLLTASTAEAEQAEKSGFIRQGVAFYAPRQSAIPIYRFRSVRDGSFFYATAKSAGEAQQFDNEGIAFHAVDDAQANGRAMNTVAVVARYRHASSRQYFFTAARESPYVVGAYYFGAFSPSSKQQIAGTARIYGRNDDWWGGVSDFYGNQPGVAKNTRKWSGDFSGLKPAIGYYNQQSVETLRKHIHQASDAGLSFFSFYWYWSNKRNGELFPEALQAFQKANVAGFLKFNISFYAHPWDDDMAIDSANAAVIIDRIIAYFRDPNYLRLPDGRPVFVMGDHRNIHDVNGRKCVELTCYLKAVDQFLALLKKTTQAKLGVVPFVQIQAGAPGWNEAGEVDGVTCLVPPITINGGTAYPKLAPELFAQLANAKKPVSPCMLQNFDERPRQDVLLADRGAIRYFVGKTDAAFRHNLEITKRFADTAYASQKNPASRIIYLYAWNEWHEGGILEPNSATGANDLNIVTDVFHLPRAPSRCLDQGDC